MTYLIVLAALFIERVLQQTRPQRRHRWFGRYFDRFSASPVVDDALAPVWRSLAVWVAIIAGGSLVAALA